MKYKNNLLYRLTEYEKNGLTPFHMPGHKRNAEMIPDINAYGIDITEIDGFDDMNHPDPDRSEGVFKNAMERAARVFGIRKTYFLVNGATSGILAAITAVCHNGGKLLLAANSHKSAFNAAYINKIDPLYVFPDEHEVIHAEDVERAFFDYETKTYGEKNDEKDQSVDGRSKEPIQCVFITSPTYTGVVSDIKSIAEVVHRHGAILVVDEAHGAHMVFHDIFPESALRQGADIVIHGIHKTLPALTQTALLHLGEIHSEKGTEIESEIERMISIFTSSSPSYILSGSIDYSMDYLETDGKEDFEKYADNLKKIYERLSGLKNLSIMSYGKDRDASKIVVRVNTGKDLYNYFRTECGIQPEMSQPDYVVLMTSVWDSKENLDKLADAIIQADSELPETSCLKCEETGKADEIVGKPDIRKLIGKTADHMIYVYPPGVPIVRPGEMIDENNAKTIEYYMTSGYKVYGLDEVV